VLLIDWDLEAPGLHRYLRPFLVDPELASSPGMIDFVWDAARVTVTPADKTQATSVATEFPSLEDYVIGLDCDFLRNRNGLISFIPAGRQDENYAQRVNTFSWLNFYERLGGGKLLQAEVDALRKSYDFILIDSRTGVSDTAGICTVQLPDMLAVFFTLNRQSIRGAAAVASSVQAQRGPSFPIYPVPTRIENGEQEKLKFASAYARRTFAPFLLHVQSDPDEQDAYWHEVETPYISFYAFEEVPAAFMEERGSLRGVLAPTERLAARLSDQRVTALKPEPDGLRKRVVAAYEFRENEEQARKVEWDAAPAPRNRLSTALASVARLLALRPWQSAAIALGVMAAILGARWWLEYLRQQVAIASAQEAQKVSRQQQDALKRIEEQLILLQTRPASLTGAQERALKPKDTFEECRNCPQMIVVPAGSFLMGSPANEQGRNTNEGPQHRVTIEPQFAVGQFALTFDEWDACVADGGCNGYKPSDQGWGRGRRPVINVSRSDANGYVAWLSRATGKTYRLLTEAEYEYAARAGTQTAYPWGNDIGKNNANCNGCGSQWDGKQTAPVGSFPPNGFGLYDMVGNVWAWTEDCYHERYIGAPTNGSAWPGDCEPRVVRAGAWGEPPNSVRSATRFRFFADIRLTNLGFRVGRTLLPP
jgi:formylglycine-generating enzyme required for sulfatase activity